MKTKLLLSFVGIVLAVFAVACHPVQAPAATPAPQAEAAQRLTLATTTSTPRFRFARLSFAVF